MIIILKTPYVIWTLGFPIEMDAGLYHLMIEGKLRVITFNGLGAQTAQQIQRLRPIPTYTAVLASGPAMIDIIDVVGYLLCNFSV